jgi:hypothetical protein
MPTSILLRADQVIEEACLLQRMSLFLALFGHGAAVAACPLLGEKQTSPFHLICEWPLLARSGPSRKTDVG